MDKVVGDKSREKESRKSAPVIWFGRRFLAEDFEWPQEAGNTNERFQNDVMEPCKEEKEHLSPNVYKEGIKHERISDADG